MSRASTQSNRTPFVQRPLDVGGVLAIALSIATSVLANSMLPSRMRIHWSFGGPYYGPEFASTLVVLAVFPLLVAGFYVGGRWLRASLDQTEGFDAVRLLYEGCILLLLTGVVLAQFVIILANLG